MTAEKSCCLLLLLVALAVTSTSACFLSCPIRTDLNIACTSAFLVKAKAINVTGSLHTFKVDFIIKANAVDSSRFLSNSGYFQVNVTSTGLCAYTFSLNKSYLIAGNTISSTGIVNYGYCDYRWQWSLIVCTSVQIFTNYNPALCSV